MKLRTCLKCHRGHAKPNSGGYRIWRAAEEARLWGGQNGLPVQALAPAPPEQPGALSFNVYDKRNGRMPARRSAVQYFSGFREYCDWLRQEGRELRDKKHARFVTNPTLGLRRKEHNQISMRRIWFDSDGAGTWDRLAAELQAAGVTAIFQESSSSVRKRTEARAAGLPDPAIVDWHVEILLAYDVPNLWSTKSKTPPSDPRWRHYQTEFKRQDRLLTGFFSALAGFEGVGKRMAQKGEPEAESACGFDLATAQMCHPRFLGSRHHPHGPTPTIFQVGGASAINYWALLHALGYEELEYVEPGKAKVRRIPYVTPTGERTTRAVASFTGQFYADVKSAITVNEFLRNHLNLVPTHENSSGGDYFFCPIHNEGANPNPNTQGFHVFKGQTEPHEHWKCHGDCDTGGDVIHLAANVWGVSAGKAARRLATLVGLDPNQYLDRVLDEERRPPSEQVPADELEDEGQDESEDEDEDEEVEGYRRKRTRYKPLEHCADWVEAHVLPLEDPVEVLQPLVRWLIDGGKDPATGAFRVLQSPDRVADTLYSVLHERLDRSQILATVMDVKDRLVRGKPVAGRRVLLNTIGYSRLQELAWAARQDDAEQDYLRGGYSSYLRRVNRFDRLSRGDREWLAEVQKTFDRVFLPQPPEHGEDEAAWDAYKERLKRHQRVKNQIVRPFSCMAFKQQSLTNYNRPYKEFHIVCEGRTCSRCFMRRLHLEEEVALKKWAGVPVTKDKPVRFLSIELKTYDQIERLKEHMRRLGRPRMTILAVRNGNPYVVFATRGFHRAAIRSELIYFRQLERKKGYELGNHEEWDVTDKETAIATILHWKHSLNMALAEAIRSQDVATLTDMLLATTGKHQISRSKHALPWVTNDEIRTAALEAVKPEVDDEDLHPDEEVTAHRLIHAATNTVLGEQKHPYTLLQAVTIAKNSQVLRAVMQRRAAEQHAALDRARRRVGFARPPT